MSWAKIDDHLHSNEKVLGCSLAARGLWLMCLSWVADRETDGAIPRSVARLHGGEQWATLAEELVECGLWEEREAGWAFHDYLAYNPPAEKIRAEREAARERMGRRRSDTIRRIADDTPHEEKSNDSDCSPELRPNFARTSPAPVPDPESRYITTALDDRRLGSTPRVYTQHCGDLAPSGPREAEPVPVVTTPPPDTPPDSRPERLSVSRRRPERIAAKDLVESLLHEADADPLRRHWRGVLLAAERDADPERPDAWRLKVLRNWLAGDGAPPPPESRSERPAPGTLPAVPARASPSYPAPRLAAPRRLTPAEARDAEYRQRLADRHAARLQELEA